MQYKCESGESLREGAVRLGRPQGFLASLELLPMWSGVEPDVELYASGCMLEDDGEWLGGQSLSEFPAEGAGSTPALPAKSVLYLFSPFPPRSFFAGFEEIIVKEEGRTSTHGSQPDQTHSNYQTGANSL